MLGNSRRRLVAATLIGSSAVGGCTSRGSDNDGAAPAKLAVHVGLFGGPARPDGGMALSNSPASGQNVTVVDAIRRKHTIRTDAEGVATFRLAPGRYTVVFSYCGAGPHHVVLAAQHTTRVEIDCAVP